MIITVGDALLRQARGHFKDGCIKWKHILNDVADQTRTVRGRIADCYDHMETRLKVQKTGLRRAEEEEEGSLAVFQNALMIIRSTHTPPPHFLLFQMGTAKKRKISGNADPFDPQEEL